MESAGGWILSWDIHHCWALIKILDSRFTSSLPLQSTFPYQTLDTFFVGAFFAVVLITAVSW